MRYCIESSFFTALTASIFFFKTIDIRLLIDNYAAPVNESNRNITSCLITNILILGNGYMKRTTSALIHAIQFAVIGAALVPCTASATNGLFMIGYGTPSRGMGGVAIAHPADSISGVANPANVSQVGNRFDVGMDLFTADVTGQLGSVTTPSNVDLFKVDNLFPMPAVGYTDSLNEKYSFGVSMIPAGGGAVHYDTNFYQAAAGGDTSEELSVALIISQVHLSLAYKMNKQNSFGVSLITGIQVFSAKGIQLFDPFTQTNGTNTGFSNQGYDWSFGLGAKVGWLGTFNDLKVGVAYQTKVYMQDFDKYTELFADHGNFDTPANIGAGISYDIKPEWSVAADITYTYYEGVKALSNPGPNLAGNPSGVMDPLTQSLGLPGGLGFGWSNQTVYKIGTEYAFNEKWTGRAGWNYAKSPIDENTKIIFNLLAPAIAQNHLTLGGTYRMSPTMEINGSFVHAFKFKQAGPTYVSDDGSNLGSLEMEQNSLGASFSMKF